MGRRKEIKLTSEEKEDMKGAIKEFFRKERDEDIGDLASLILLDFVIEELAPSFYNKGVEEACQYLEQRMEDARSMLM